MTSTATPTPLLGRTALVTGSTSGIGAAIARALARQGAQVVVVGRNAARGADVVDAVRRGGGRADFVGADLGGSYSHLRAFAIDATAALGGQVDILVNTPGSTPPR